VCRSAAHTHDDGQRYAANVARLAADLESVTERASAIFGEGQYN
jgi:hypothetical protein